MSTGKRGRPKGSKNQTPVNITKAIQTLWSHPHKMAMINLKLEDVIMGDNNKDALKAIEILLKYIAVSADKVLEVEAMADATLDRQEQLDRIKQLTK